MEDIALQHSIRRRRPLVGEHGETPDLPLPSKVLGEIGLILAVHLAAAFAVVLVLRMAGIA